MNTTQNLSTTTADHDDYVIHGAFEVSYSVKDLADELHVSVQTIYDLRTQGRGPVGFRVGRCLRFRRSEIDAHGCDGRCAHGDECEGSSAPTVMLVEEATGEPVELHLVMHNYAAHKQMSVREWLAENTSPGPTRFRVPSTPYDRGYRAPLFGGARSANPLSIVTAEHAKTDFLGAAMLIPTRRVKGDKR